MESVTSPRKPLKSPENLTANLNVRTSITCMNVPEGLFDTSAAKKHFSKFGRAQKIRLFPKKQMCIVEYDQPSSVDRAVLNAGAFDGFMFDVIRTKNRVRRKSKKDDDPDWVPDSDVEEELSAMSGAPIYRVPRQKPIPIDTELKINPIKRVAKQQVTRHKTPVREKTKSSQPTSGIESPVTVPTAQSTISTSEAAAELNQLRSRTSVTPDEQWRTLDARDRILRAWGGAGSRVKIGGATIGTCPDMCPEKELLHRQSEHQVMTLETVPDSDGQLEPWRAVKQYSRSSADQEIPMCYELRPPQTLMRTTAYLLHEIADTTRQVSLADWFHFMWDRFRGIRKDITQQALCCAESIWLVEICARFHAHCAARLADLEHTQFDQKLNTDNLTKCLQTLKHMYTDVTPDQKPREAEFRGYIALLNLGDANFWWEIKQLPLEIQKSEAITFAIKIFNALDNNNYVRFFRLIKEQATYLQACILLRYFNDVRARGLARIVKAYAPRGGSRYPAEELMNSLAFESSESMRSFINHYGLRFGKDESDLIVILDRNQFIEDSDPYPLARSIKLIESKRQNTVGELIAGGSIPNYDYANHSLYTSFTKEGKLKESALIAEEQGYNTINDSNKDLQALKAEIKRLSKGGRNYGNAEREPKSNLFVKSETKPTNSAKSDTFVAPINNTRKNQFSFKPAIPVAPTEVIKLSPEKVSIGDMKNIFSFSKPQETYESNSIANNIGGPFKTNKHVFASKTSESENLFMKSNNENKDPFPNSQTVFRTPDHSTLFKKPEIEKNIFGQAGNEIKNTDSSKNVFGNVTSTVFGKKDGEHDAGQNAFATNIFTKIAPSKSNNSTDNIFAKASAGQENDPKQPGNIFGSFGKPNVFAEAKHMFGLPENTDSQTQPIFAHNGDASNQLSPGTFFKSAVNSDGKPYSIFQSKNKAQSVAENIFNSVNASMPNKIVYEFDPNDDTENQDQLQRQHEERIKEEMERKLKEEEQRRKELIRLEEEKRNEEQRRKLLEIKKLEEQRKKEEERKQEELRKKLEEERKAEMKRKAEESERKFKERVEKESTELIEELVNEVRDETLREILSEEVEKMKKLMSYAGEVTEETWMELCDEICRSEMTAEKFRTEKVMKKWFYVWRQQLLRNFKRRYLLEDTPVWLTDKTPVEEATYLKRPVESDALKSMNAIHRGYKFTGELRLPPAPEPYNIMEIIKSPLLKRMKQINYPYDKCFFWKLTVVSPGDTTWLCRKIEMEKWILDVFGDKKKHEMSDSLIRVEKQSWNHLMDFAISVSLTNKTSKLCSEAVEGTNGLLFYTTEHDINFIDTLQETLKHKYPYQVIPIVVIMPEMNNDSTYKDIQQILTDYANKNMISGFKICVLDSQNVFDSLNICTKSALKWIAKRYPRIPPLETDYLKSICQRYLGNEIWYRLKSETDGRVNMILKDLSKLVQCYNTAVDKLTESITNEDLFNHPPFPLEFNQYLDHTSPYPKPYEFIATNTRNSDNTHAIKDTMKKLKLPDPVSEFQPLSVVSLQDQIRKYCNQLEWFENPEQVVCKVVAVFPNQFSNLDMSHKHFSEYFEHYDLTDFLNIMVYEKINRLNNFDNRFAIYEKTALEDYKNTHWLYEIEILSRMKHKALEYEDELDMFIEAKRRKIAIDSMEYLMLEDKDSTMVEENIKFNDEKISKYTNCETAVKQLEEQIELERQKSMQLENLLKSALSNV